MKTHLHLVLRKMFQLLLFICFALSQPAYAANSAGEVVIIKGLAWAQLTNEAVRKLEKGSFIYQSDVIKTEKGSTVQLLFNDQTKFFLGAETEMSVDKFNNQGSAEERGFISRVVKGTFRFVTGLIAHDNPEAMQINTPVAAIGIRGTHVVAEADATSATIVLIEPEGDARKTSIEVSNPYGSVLIDEPGYGTNIPDEFSAPSLPRRMRLQTVNNIMRSMQSIQRINIPRPRMP